MQIKEEITACCNVQVVVMRDSKYVSSYRKCPSCGIIEPETNLWKIPW